MSKPGSKNRLGHSFPMVKVIWYADFLKNFMAKNGFVLRNRIKGAVSFQTDNCLAYMVSLAKKYF